MKRESLTAWLYLAGIIAGGILLFRATQHTPVPVERNDAGRPDTTGFVSIMVDPRTSPVGMYWRDKDGKAIRSLERLREYELERGRRLRFAMNGGMYREDRSPVGLFIQHGRTLSPLDTSSGSGNFHLKPNGVFLVRKDGTAGVVTTGEFPGTVGIEHATQSGPMLVIGGAMHPAFGKDSENRNIRNGVGVRPDGTVVFAISKTAVTFYEFASYFMAMGCRDALYLDGLVSRCYLPEKNWTQLDGDFGVMIGVTE